jgi:hypothetical protein
MKLTLLTLLLAASSASPLSFSGVKTTQKDMPLQLIKSYNRKDKFTLTYWTQLIESRECIRQPFDCNLSEYD